VKYFMCDGVISKKNRCNGVIFEVTAGANLDVMKVVNSQNE